MAVRTRAVRGRALIGCVLVRDDCRGVGQKQTQSTRARGGAGAVSVRAAGEAAHPPRGTRRACCVQVCVMAEGGRRACVRAERGSPLQLMCGLQVINEIAISFQEIPKTHVGEGSGVEVTKSSHVT